MRSSFLDQIHDFFGHSDDFFGFLSVFIVEGFWRGLVALEVSHSLEDGPEKILVVLNRSGLIGGIKSSDIHSALNRDLFTEIPNDDAKVLRSLNRGIPLISRYPRCPASKAIRALADKLEQQVIAESAIETAAAIPSPI